jgi:2,3-dihydroxybenzoate decarboxylase
MGRPAARTADPEIQHSLTEGEMMARKYKRIAVEEGFTIPEIIAEANKMDEAARFAAGLGPVKMSPARAAFTECLLDLGKRRLNAMDADGIDKALLVVSSPGVQIFTPGTGTALSRLVNDRLAEAVRTHPDRLAGLAALAPQDPAAAAAELERATRRLGLKGAIINSHTKGEYLDDRKFWAIFEAAQALDVAIYIHPREPSPQMASPLAMEGFRVGWGYAVETATHILRLISSGVFDQFPKLRLVIGHMGEGLPFMLDRIDNRFTWEHAARAAAPKIKRLPGDYVRDNVVISTSGMNYTAPLQMAIAVMGIDKILFAADYPFEVVRDSVVAMDAMPLAESDKKKIYQTNAERVFAL